MVARAARSNCKSIARQCLARVQRFADSFDGHRFPNWNGKKNAELIQTGSQVEKLASDLLENHFLLNQATDSYVLNSIPVTLV